MLYLLTSNEDRKTSSRRVMWRLQTQYPCTVYLNFRSEAHVRNGSSDVWLRSAGWARDSEMRSTVSSGIPNGQPRPRSWSRSWPHPWPHPRPRPHPRPHPYPHPHPHPRTGPYSGPVFAKRFDAPGQIELYGSDNWEGTYFVFVDLSTPETGPVVAAEAEEASAAARTIEAPHDASLRGSG